MRVLSAVDSGKPREEVAKTFSVSMPTIKRWLRRRRETGDVEPEPIPGRPARKGAMLKEWLPKHLRGQRRSHPRRAPRGFRGGVRGEGLYVHYREGHSRPARWRMADQKKSQIASERDEEARGLWRWLASRFDARRLVFVDESGFNTSMTRLRARAPGEREPTARFRVTAARTPPSLPPSLWKELWGSR